MKSFIRYFVIAAILTVLMIGTVSAAQPAVTRVVDENDYMSFRIDGTADANSDVLVFLYEQGTFPDTLDIDRLSISACGFERVVASEAGSFSAIFHMESEHYQEIEEGTFGVGICASVDGTYGYYTIPEDAMLRFVPVQIRRSAMERVQGCPENDSEKMHDIILEEHDHLLLDGTIMAVYQADAALSAFVDGILSRRPAEFQKNSDFKSAFEEGIALYIIQNASAAELPNVLDTYKSIIGIHTDPITLHPEHQNDVYMRLSNMEFTSVEMLNAAIRSMVIAERAESCTRWGELSKLMLEEYASDFQLDASVLHDYHSLSKKSEVFTALLDEKPYASVDALAAKFTAAVVARKEAEEEEHEPSSGRVGLQGGGSSPAASVNFAPVLTMPEPTPVVQEGAEKFTDLTDTAWAYASIDYLCKKGIITGVTAQTFEPSTNVTRAEFTKMLTTAAGLKFSVATAEFSDVKKDAWYYPYVCVAYTNQLVNGTGNGMFGPTLEITRQDLAIMIYRTAKFLHITLPNRDSNGVTFSDDSLIADYAREAVGALYAGNIISGFEDGTFRPGETATRAQAAVMVARLLGNDA